MRDVNTITLTGRLVRDAELKSKNGYDVLEFTIASNYAVKRNDEWKEEANFIDCRIFGKRAPKMAQYMPKGKQVTISGELRQQRWTTDAGDKKSRFVVMVENIVLTGGQKQDNQSSRQQQPQSHQDPQPDNIDNFDDDFKSDPTETGY